VTVGRISVIQAFEVRNILVKEQQILWNEIQLEL
jgi:hypothetical protein